MSDSESEEFLVSVELYVSSAAASSLRKPTATRKKEKRDLSTVTDENKKIREKSSWLTIGKSSTTDHWRNATCRLTVDGDRCLLNIYVDQTILFQTIYVHILNQTDIRIAHDSLFFRKNCLSIHCAIGQRWSSLQTSEPVYLHFANPDTLNIWLALLRSYSIPEIYGTWSYPSDGGAYRMWRQVDMTVLSGRNLGNTPKPVPSDGSSTLTSSLSDTRSDSEFLDLDVSCEILINDIVCGRTTMKKGVGSPDWHELFTFSDLPPFRTLDILVWREKKLFKPSLIGTVRIGLTNFRRGELIEGFYPVLQAGSISGDLHVGELRLKICVNEEIILPQRCYDSLLDTLNSRNSLRWIADCESKLKAKTVSDPLIAMAVAKDSLVDQIEEMAAQEIDLMAKAQTELLRGPSTSSTSTIFRGNTAFTKVAEQFMMFYGKPFLEASVAPSVRKICEEKVVIDLHSRSTPKEIERNGQLLAQWGQIFWTQIYSVRDDCPIELRRLFGTVRHLVDEKLRPRGLADTSHWSLHWQSVSALCFLRLINPPILSPHLFGIVAGSPIPPVQRTLRLIAKMIQTLANLVTTSREDHMKGVEPWLNQNVQAMIDYIIAVSTMPNDTQKTQSISVDEQQERRYAVSSMKRRAPDMPALAREAIPSLPYLLDTPRDLAVLTSAIIRHSRDFPLGKHRSDESDRAVSNLCSQSFRVEEQALQRVSHLAARINGEENGSPNSLDTKRPGNERRKRKTSRPSTAPSPSDSDTSRAQFFQNTADVSHSHKPQDRQQTTFTGDDQNVRRHRLAHLKSTSTDAMPVFSGGLPEDSLGDNYLEEASKRKRGILRGILRR